MALRKRGKNGYYHAYFRTVLSDSDGTLHYGMRTVNLGTTDLVLARAMESELLQKNKAMRMHQRVTAHLIRQEIEAGLRPVSELPIVEKQRSRPKRLLIANALEAAAKYKVIGETTRKIFRMFSKEMKSFRYMDEITPEIAFQFLTDKYPDIESGKTFNNTKSYLHTIFKLTLLDSGMKESPFARIPNRTGSGRHQRPFSEDEFIRIWNAAEEPWKSAVFIAWHTGLRQKDVFMLRWDQIDEDVLTTTPAKTARFGRSVQIPLHPDLAAYLKLLPKTGDRVLGNWEYNPDSISFRRYFGNLLKQLDIGETAAGFPAFNSFRDSFITRCDEAGIPRHAIRGIVGHMKDSQTDLYSHDLTTARQIQSLPGVKLEGLENR